MATSQIQRPLRSVLGAGTYGTVMRVKWGNTVYARKRIVHTDEDGVDLSAVRECSLLHRFKHPFVLSPQQVTVTPEGTVDVYFPLASTDLSRWLKRASAADRVAMMQRVAFRVSCVLVDFHRWNIIHRDIKPGNVLLGHDGQPYLADFGSSRELNFEAGATPPLTPVPLTPLHTRNMITYPFRPPEMVQRDYTTQADLYSLGCTLINILTGTFAGQVNVTQPPEPSEWQTLLDQHAATLPPHWADLLQALIQAEPSARPSAREILEAKVWSGSAERVVSGWLSPGPTVRATVYQPFAALVHLWWEGVRGPAQQLALEASLVRRMNRNWSLFLAREPRPPSLPTAALACFRLVLKMVTSAFPTLDTTADYAYRALYLYIDPIDLQRTESHVFHTLSFTVW